MGTTDRIIRIVLALIIAGLYYTEVITGLLGTILIALACVLVLTSVVKFCPLYLPFGVKTSKK